jgi:uncharacterized protein YcbK (DUF882 family)
LGTSWRFRCARLANQFRRLMILSGAAGVALVTPSGTQDAWSADDTRSLTFFHTHTNESATITFRRNGRYDEEALNQLNWLLRDWRVNEPAKMDSRLFDILWEVYREVGSREPIHVISAYRSPATNSMLRNRSRAVSEHSQHMSGKAMDIRLPTSIPRVCALPPCACSTAVSVSTRGRVLFISIQEASVPGRACRVINSRVFSPTVRRFTFPRMGNPYPATRKPERRFKPAMPRWQRHEAALSTLCLRPFSRDRGSAREQISPRMLPPLRNPGAWRCVRQSPSLQHRPAVRQT